METQVRRTKDFEVTGDGKSGPWRKAEWLAIAPLKGKAPGYATRAKLLYSRTGLYVFFDCRDRRLTCTLDRDGAELFNEDVVEAFFWPDERHGLYYEYEISPLNYQLSLIIPNNEGRFEGWLAWRDRGPRAIRRATSVRGGEKKSMARVSGWSAEFFVPYDLLTGLTNVPPTSGSVWRGNLYRIDYDTGRARHFAWSPPSRPNFHDYLRFGYLRFE